MEIPEAAMSGHTPGPWNIDAPYICGNGTTRYSEGYTVAVVTTGYDSGKAVAQMHGHAGVYEANARLIAAAPDLLAACRVTLEDFIQLMEGHCPQGSPEEEAVNLVAGMLRAAIAKAEGHL
jgi:hypothetical protein